MITTSALSGLPIYNRFQVLVLLDCDLIERDPLTGFLLCKSSFDSQGIP